MGDLYFGPCLNPGGDVPAPLRLSDETRAKIAEQIGALLPDGPIAEPDWPGPSDVAKAIEQVAKMRLDRQELHCHPAVTVHMRATTVEAGLPFPGAIGNLAGLPVIEHDDMEPGAWELREDGQVVSSGRLRTMEEWAQEVVYEINQAGFLPEGYRFEWAP